MNPTTVKIIATLGKSIHWVDWIIIGMSVGMVLVFHAAYLAIMQISREHDRNQREWERLRKER
jgi:hypothetical protein